MNLKTFSRALLRRWYVVAASLLVTAVAAIFAFSAIGPSYQRNASELLVPGSTNVPKGANPFLFLDGLNPAADVLVTTLQSSEVQAPLLAGHPGASITVARDTSTSGPVIIVTVSGSSKSSVAAVFDEVKADLPDTLDTLQAKLQAPKDSRISVQLLSADATATVSQKSRMETTGLIAVAGVVLSVLLAALIDGLLASRSPRRRGGDRRRPTGIKEHSIPRSTAATRGPGKSAIRISAGK